MLLLNIDAEVKEDQTRMLSHGIQLLETALEGKIQEIKITMNKPDGLKKLKEFMDIEGQGAPASLYICNWRPGSKSTSVCQAAGALVPKPATSSPQSRVCSISPKPKYIFKIVQILTFSLQSCAILVYHSSK